LLPKIQRKSAWARAIFCFGHFALTDESGRRFFFSDRIERGNLGLASAQAPVPVRRASSSATGICSLAAKRGERQSFRARA
jgi:predicted secreted hydrolase